MRMKHLFYLFYFKCARYRIVRYRAIEWCVMIFLIDWISNWMFPHLVASATIVDSMPESPAGVPTPHVITWSGPKIDRRPRECRTLELFSLATMLRHLSIVLTVLTAGNSLPLSFVKISPESIRILRVSVVSTGPDASSRAYRIQNFSIKFKIYISFVYSAPS